MVKPNVVTTLETTKRSIFMMDPAQLFIVGIDFGDESTPGYDPRVKLPMNDRLVESIIQDGVIRTVIARKDGERSVVVDGRRRVMHARAANLRLQANNPTISADDLIKVPVEFKRGDELALMGVSRTANKYDVKDSPLVEAGYMQQMLNKGASEERIATVFDVDVVTVRDRIKLLDLAPEAAEALSKQIISNNAALELSGISMADQVKVLQKTRDDAVNLLPGGKLKTAAIASAVRETKKDTGAVTRKTPSDVRKEICKLIEQLADGVAKSPRPMGKDNRTAEMPEPASMFAVLRKVARLAHPDNRSWDQQVKALIPKPGEEDEETEAKPALKATK